MSTIFKSTAAWVVGSISGWLYSFVGLSITAYFALSRRLRGISSEEANRLWRQRMGYMPRIPGRGIWIHGASLGEITAISSMISELEKKYPGRQIIISLMNEGDYETVTQNFKSAVVILLPFDLSRFVARALDKIHPAMVIFTESEIWPVFLKACTQRSIPVHLVNARASERASLLYSLMPQVFRSKFFSGFRSVQVRDESDLDHYRKMGLSPDVVSISGDLRWNYEPPPHLISSGRLLGQRLSRPMWVAASLHDRDIKPILAIHQYLRLHIRDVLLLLVPRYPTKDRVMIEREITTRGLKHQLIDASFDADSATDSWIDSSCSVAWVQRTGDLIRWYAAADLALICGSFNGIGGHNPIEAALADCAIFSGTRVENFSHTYRQFAEYQACVMHSDPVALGELMLKTLNDDEHRRTLCGNAINCVRNQRLEVGKAVAKLVAQADFGEADVDQAQQKI